MIDVHCHLTLLRPSTSLGTTEGQAYSDKIINDAREAGVTAIITSGTSFEDSQKTVELAEKYVEVWATVGIHPEEISDIRDVKYEIREKLQKLIHNKKVVAIGEIGLDYREAITEAEKEKQRNLFRLQLDLACETGLPVVVHNRNADEDIYQVLSAKYKVLRGKFSLHCFTRNIEFMQKMAGWGAYFSFGGMITYKNNQRMRNVAKMVPRESLLLETDSPYSLPSEASGDINTPANVKIVAGKMAEIRSVSIEEIDLFTSINARRLFPRLK